MTTSDQPRRAWCQPMRKHKIKTIRGYKSPRAIAGRPSIIAPNHLQRACTVDASNPNWVTDITYMGGRKGGVFRDNSGRNHCASIVACGKFSGPDFSKRDDYIADGASNQPCWKDIGQVRNISLRRQSASNRVSKR